MTTAPLAAIATQTSRDKVYLALRDAIFTGALRLGQPVTETNLSAQLGVSRPIIREALQRLAEQGLVEQSPYRSTRVFWLSPAECHQLVDLRALLEGVAIRQALPHVDGRALERLRAAAMELETSLEGADYPAVLAQDLDFHRLLWSYACNRPLSRVLETICWQVFAIMSQLRHVEGLQYPRGQYGHLELIEALEQGERPSRIEQWVRNHVTHKWRVATGYGDKYEVLFGADPAG